MKIALGVMTRAPSSAGKTRLASHLSPQRLTALRVALLADTLRTVERLPDVFIFFTPDEAEHEIASVAGRAMRCVAQRGGDLGARMLAALRHLLDAEAFDAALLIGSDIPMLEVDRVNDAIEMLQAGGDVVLGPADDGGYYLIAMRQAHAALFDKITWGSASVLADTLRAAERAGVGARLMSGAYDIDTIDDLRRLERDLASASPDACPAVRRWLLDGQANG